MPPAELIASPLLPWPAPIAAFDARQAQADRVLGRLADGQRIGIGSGAVAYLTLHGIGRRVRERGLAVTVVCAGYETATAAQTLGLGLAELGSVELDWAIDSADEVDPQGRLLQSHASTPLMAKLLWSTATHIVLATGPGAGVPALGRELPLPVEVHRDAVSLAARELAGLGASDVALRLATGKDGPVFTASGNLLLDARFPVLGPGLDAAIAAVPGVAATGLFEDRAFERLVP